MIKFASAGSLDALRGLICEFYCCDASQIDLTGGAVYKNHKKMSTEYIKKGARWYFIKRVDYK